VFNDATTFTFAGDLSAWDVRVVASMGDMFGNEPSNFPNVSASFCGFYWTTSGTAQIQFGDGLIPDIRCSLFPTSLSQSPFSQPPFSQPPFFSISLALMPIQRGKSAIAQW
jgi:hypothetical protein